MKKPFFAMALLCSILMARGQEARIFTSDIDHFWNAYDSVATTTDSIKQIGFIQNLYINKASAGLNDFMAARQHSASRHLKNMLAYPKFWSSVRPLTLDIQSHTTEIENLLTRFKALYPGFKRPGIYFTIGVLNAGGTAGPDKILIGSEIACSNSSTDASELNSWLQGVFKDNQDVVSLVAHELGHTQQKQAGTSLLSRCIMEGACDFIAELLLQKPVSSPYMRFGRSNEEKLWMEFQPVMLGQEVKAWLYNGAQAPGGHADCGYFMGYEICKSYYDHAIDKQAALKQIIELNYDEQTVTEFLQQSAYHGAENQKTQSIALNR